MKKMGLTITMNMKQIKWTIFSTLLFLFPTGFYLYFDFAIWPVLYPLAGKVAFPLLRGQFPGSLIVLLITCFLWIVVLYLVSKRLALKINNQETIRKLVLTVTTVIVIVLLGMAPIYHGGPYLKEKSSAFTLYWQLF
jgi:hypothetical protein